MCCKGFVKRIVPFFLTFAVGLFIASFFVTVVAPSLKIPNRGWRRNHRQYDRQMELENQRLRDENLRLRNEAQQKFDKFAATYEMNDDGSVKRIVNIEATTVGEQVDEFVPPPIPNNVGSDGISEPRRIK